VIVTEQREDDPALGALSALSDVAESSATSLTRLGDELSIMRRRRKRGWSWRRIVSADDSPNPMSIVTRIINNLGRASSELRRALARALRNEGLQVTEIAGLFGVSRQRVSALFRRGAPTETRD
jgi:predicted XRE-type DNA-binding protein